MIGIKIADNVLVNKLSVINKEFGVLEVVSIFKSEYFIERLHILFQWFLMLECSSMDKFGSVQWLRPEWLLMWTKCSLMVLPTCEYVVPEVHYGNYK